MSRNPCDLVRCARPEDPKCKVGERLVVNEGAGCCAPSHVCVSDERKPLYSSCGIFSFLPEDWGGPKVATLDEIRRNVN